jgi:hypothetical protein
MLLSDMAGLGCSEESTWDGEEFPCDGVGYVEMRLTVDHRTTVNAVEPERKRNVHDLFDQFSSVE